MSNILREVVDVMDMVNVKMDGMDGIDGIDGIDGMDGIDGIDDDWDIFNEMDDCEDEYCKNDDVLPQEFNNCSHSESIYDQRGSYEICTICGLVLQEKIIDSTPEWRTITNSQQFSSDPVRCSAINPLLPQSSLSTTIAINGKSNASNYLLMVMNTWQSMPYSERSMFDVFSYLDEVCRYYVSKAIIHAAKIFYTKAYKKNMELSKTGRKREGLRGKKRKGLIAACLFYACKQNNEHKTKQDIGEILDIPKAYVTKGCKIFLDLMKNSIINDITNNNIASDCGISDIMNPKHFIQQFGKQLKLDNTTIKYTLNLYAEMESFNIFFGNQPPSIAGGIMFIMLKCLNPYISETVISDKCAITKVTIMNVYRQLKTHENILLFNVFAKDCCFKIGGCSDIILFKILTIGKYLLLHSNFTLPPNTSPQLLSYAITYMVLFYSHSHINKPLLLKFMHPYNEQDLCGIISKLIFYKKAIFDSVLNPIIFPKGIDIARPCKKRKITNNFLYT